jgi:redox-sensitive bicupin YhaK (pirin superfamily)
MNITRYSADSRGNGSVGWLQSEFSFSFANYFDPARMGFGKLRVLNDDIIASANGFGMHEHDNMEIVTLVTEGTLAHKDTEGNGGILHRNDVQVMSAGSGLAHSEINNSTEEPVKLFQLWIESKEENIKPHYDQKTFMFPDNVLVPVASGLGDEGALYIHQDARILVGILLSGNTQDLKIGIGSGVFAMVVEGSATIGTEKLGYRDAVEITGTESVAISTELGCKLLIVETVL